MPQLAPKYYDFADNYPAEYGISKALAGQRPKLVINPIVIQPKLFDFWDEAGTLPSRVIDPVDKTEAELSRWDDTGEIEMLIGDILKNQIRIPEISKVKNFLSNYPELKEILPLVSKVTKKKFPSGKAQLSLEIDYDIESQDEQLVLFIRQDHYEEDILETIDEIRSRYSDSLIGKKAWIIVMTDFASPK